MCVCVLYVGAGSVRCELICALLLLPSTGMCNSLQSLKRRKGRSNIIKCLFVMKHSSALSRKALPCNASGFFSSLLVSVFFFCCSLIRKKMPRPLFSPGVKTSDTSVCLDALEKTFKRVLLSLI